MSEHFYVNTNGKVKTTPRIIEGRDAAMDVMRKFLVAQRTGTRYAAELSKEEKEVASRFIEGAIDQAFFNNWQDEEYVRKDGSVGNSFCWYCCGIEKVRIG